GELKPCGCAKEEDQGGIERRSGYLKKVRAHAKNTLLLDTGDNFKEPSRQGKLKAETLMRAMASMEYDAVTLGDHDLVYGHRFLLEKKGIPWTSANIRWGDSSLPPYRIKTFENGIKAAVVAVSDPDLFYGTRHSDLHIDDPRTAVESLLKPLKDRERPDLVVLLTHMNRAKALELLNLNGVDVVVNGHIQNPTDTIDLEPVRRKGKIFVQPGPRGQKLA
ncbi:MAG: hypothetical protein GWM98_06570, partial [Nitrospinaceae bacterium]|nr:hypothetical protein [Nitrospinaceae bacterium]NIR54219.1 hypothetical protein [Nitrospinaceae bacterium]NIS84634.1 hypothetical protein [Nitrospinaceae bacterium]NIT81429.1 hypothetical protein [Nitrospinaceae bacterium]NIU43712.1 hypothetical protein [Nitrospinaceae bacterium]